MYNYLTDDCFVDKEVMGTKVCLIECEIKFKY